MDKLTLFGVCLVLCLLVKLASWREMRLAFLLGIFIATAVPWLAILVVGHGLDTTLSFIDLPIYASAAAGLVMVAFGWSRLRLADSFRR